MRPREISSRSASDRRSSDRFGGAGANPPARFTSHRTAQSERFSRREIPRKDSPADTARQISAFSSSLSFVTTHHLRSDKPWLVHRGSALILRNQRTSER